MPKFIFNLETLLRHRKNLEQRERDALLRLNYKYQMEMDTRNSLAARFQETMNGIAQKCENNSIDDELSWFYLYLNRLTQEIKECEKRLAQLKSEIEAQKEAVIDASKKRKTLVSMRAKREKEFIVAQEKQEQKEVDDLVVTRYTAPESARQSSAEIFSESAYAKHE